jgi:hypothetical protein
VFSAAKGGQFNVPFNANDAYVEARQGSIPLNTGVMFFRSSKWSSSFLEDVYIEAEYVSYWGVLGFFDQASFMHYQQQHTQSWIEHVTVVPYKYINGRTDESLFYHVAGGADKLHKYDFLLSKCKFYNCRSALQDCGNKTNPHMYH